MSSFPGTGPTPYGSAGPDPQRLAAASPSTSSAELAYIAQARPDLHALIAANPSTDPNLLTWLRQSPDPQVQAALARRGTTPPPTSPAAPVAPVTVPPPPTSQDLANAAAGAPSPTPPTNGVSPAQKKSKAFPVKVACLALVAVLVSAGGVFAATRLLNKDNTNGPIEPDSSWAQGSHKTWSLNTDEDSYVTGNGDQLLAISYDSDRSPTAVTAYDVSGKEPKEQWDTKISTDLGIFSYWGDSVFVVGDQLVPLDGSEPTDAPWDKDDDKVYVLGDVAVACDSSDTCSAWNASDPSKELWSQDIKDSYTTLTSGSDQPIEARAYVGDQIILMLSRDTAVEVSSGETYTFDVGDSGYAWPLADGWVIFDSEKEEEVTFTSPTGEEKETVEGKIPDSSDDRFVPTLTQLRPTTKQYKSYIVDGDLSWAENTAHYEDSSNSDDCGTRLTIGETTLTPANDSGSCTANGYKGYISYNLSGDKKLLTETYSSPLERHMLMPLTGMWSVEDDDLVSFEGASFGQDAFYLLDPKTIIAWDADGTVQAYAPGKK